MCDIDMDMDVEYDTDIETNSDVEYDMDDNIDFDCLEFVDDVSYEEFNIPEISEYSTDIFSDAAFLDMEAGHGDIDEIMEEAEPEFTQETVEEFELEPDVMLDSANGLEDISGRNVEVQSEITASPEEIDRLLNSRGYKEYLENLRAALQSGRISVELAEDFDEEDSPKVLTREITPEMLESRERDTNEVLDNYRDNLRGYGVEEEKIEEYINQEREKINAEYESLDQGDMSSNIYYQPENWEEVASSLTNSCMNFEYQETERENVNIQETEQLGNETLEQDTNYSEIYEEIQQESLEQGFEEIQIDADPEKLESSLENFEESTWETFSLEEQKNSMSDLADYVEEVIGFDNPPSIEYYNNPQEGDFGGYDPDTNTLHVNEYMLYNSNEAADTIAHELWHAHQHECAMNPQNTRDYQYQYNFDNYIPPSLGQEAYETQLVEAEARAFAAQFKDRLDMIKGRSK